MAAFREKPLTPAVTRSPGIDALRIVAAAMVLIYHLAHYGPRAIAPGPLDLVSVAGRTGVVVFFVISGFVLYAPIRDCGPDLRKYAARRFLRIYPAYVVAWFGAVVLLGSAFDPAYLVFAQTWPVTEQAPLDVSWTLQIEVVFYALLPFIAAAVRGRGPAPLMALAVLGYLASVLWLPRQLVGVGPIAFLACAWTFPLGMLIAHVPRRRPPLYVAAGATLVALGLVTNLDAGVDAPTAIGAALLIVGLREAHVPQALGWLGSRLSYPVYLWHPAVLHAVPSLFGVVVVFAVALASWRLVERPMLHALTARRRVVAA